MPTAPPVIVGVGLTKESSYVLEKVAGLARDPDRLIAVHVLERNPLTYTDDTASVLENLYLQLRDEAVKQLKDLCDPVGVTRMEVVEGHPAQALHKMAEDTDAAVVAVGTHGLRGWRALLGETANAVLHDTRNNVLAILTRDEPGEPKLTYENILVAVDLSDEASAVIEEALRVKERYNGRITLMSVIKPFTALANPMMETATTSVYESFIHEAESQCKAHLAKLAQKYGIEDVLLKHGQPAAEIHSTAESIGADLVVLGTHGTHGPALLLGSTPNAVLHGMTCDVLAVRVGL